MFDQPLLLDMIFLGTPQLRGGVNILFFFKVSFEKHPNVQFHTMGHNSITDLGVLYQSQGQLLDV